MDTVDQSDLLALLNSGHFDSNWYVQRYPDVAFTGLNPAEHYLWLGRRLGRRGKPSRAGDELISFSSCDASPVRTSDDDGDVFSDDMVRVLADWRGLDKEYVCYQLGVKPEQNSQLVAKMYYDGLKRRNIQPNPLFDPEYYKLANDLKFRDDAIYHFLTRGMKEHLRTHRLFDHDWYLSQVSSAKEAEDLISHYWENGYKDKVLPVNPEIVRVLEPVREAFFANDPGSMLDYNDLIYREFNPDLKGLDEQSLKSHYEKSGRAEGRMASISALLKKFDLAGHCLPIDFDPEQYMSLHVDLEQAFSDNPWGSLTHYIGGGLSEGRLYHYGQVNGHIKPVNYVLDQEALRNSGQKKPLCVLVHLYYPEMWSELKPYILNIDLEFDLRVNFVESTWHPEVVALVREDFPDALVKISPNEGRDIGGFFSLLRDVDFTRYVAFALVHSKKSPHVTKDYASLWKKNLLGAILGSADLIRENIAAFLEDEQIGIIGSVRSRHAGIEGNQDGMKKLFEIYRISDENQGCEYVSGTMMMVRAEIMQSVYTPLSHHKFLNGDNKGIDHHIDGQVEHSVERIFGNVMRQLGYRFLWR